MFWRNHARTIVEFRERIMFYEEMSCENPLSMDFDFGRLVLFYTMEHRMIEVDFGNPLFYLLCFAIYHVTILAINGLIGFYKFFLMPPVTDLLQHYGGKGTWCVITGAR